MSVEYAGRVPGRVSRSARTIRCFKLVLTSRSDSESLVAGIAEVLLLESVLAMTTLQSSPALDLEDGDELWLLEESRGLSGAAVELEDDFPWHLLFFSLLLNFITAWWWR